MNSDEGGAARRSAVLNRRSALGVMSVFCGAGKAAQATAATAPGRDMRVGRLRLHVAAGGARAAGVLVQPTIAGLTGTMRSFAADLAAAGLTAVVWDPYDGEDQGPDRAEQIKRSQALTDEGVLAGLSAATDFMTGELGVKAIGAVGWCMGGRTALIHAGRDARIKAVSAYNPTILTDKVIEIWGMRMSRADAPGQTLDEFDLAGRIAGPVQIARPGTDIMQPDDYARMADRLYARPHPTLIDYYPKAGHGFSYTLDTPENVQAARMAWAATRALFTSYLPPPG